MGVFVLIHLQDSKGINCYVLFLVKKLRPAVVGIIANTIKKRGLSSFPKSVIGMCAMKTDKVPIKTINDVGCLRQIFNPLIMSTTAAINDVTARTQNRSSIAPIPNLK